MLLLVPCDVGPFNFIELIEISVSCHHLFTQFYKKEYLIFE